jgi:hypothetical protein
MNDIKPLSIASCPKDGPTTSDCKMSAVAGNLPALNTFAKSCASKIEKLPEI